MDSLRIEKLVYGGDGLARLDGKVVLTPFVLPGELVEAEVDRAKNDLFRGRAAKILEPSPVRAEPACPYFRRCGGCHYQHTGYEFQLEQKRAILIEALRRVGRIEFEGVIPTLSADPWQYRNRTQLHIRDRQLGFFAPGSHEIVPVDHCPIASPKLNEAIAQLAAGLSHYRSFEVTVELFTNETDVQVNILDKVPSSVKPLFDDLGTTLPIEYDGFRISRNSFFQVNRHLIHQLVDCAIGGANGTHAVNLYAGVGLFTRKLAARFQKVTAVETGTSAHRDLESNMQRVGLNVECLRRSTEEYLIALNETPDWILADPPRAGLGKQPTRDLVRLECPRLTIVSCDPATLARDLRALLDGGYRIETMTLVDLFPQTYHLETVVQLKRSS